MIIIWLSRYGEKSMDSFSKAILAIIAVALSAFAFMLTILTMPAHSTTIVGIRTPKLLVIAGDSVGTFRGTGRPENTRLVCKVFCIQGAGFAISGLNKDPARGFDAEAIVAKALGDVVDFVDLLIRSL